MLLQCNTSSLKPHPEGVHSAVCVDVIDLGMVESEFEGRKRLVQKLRLLFETEALTEEGKRYLLGKTCTASLHQKSRLAEFLSKWRGRPISPGEVIDLNKLVGVSCTLVVNHATLNGRVFASIAAITKPIKKVIPSGTYDPEEARRKIQEWKTQDAAPAPAPVPTPTRGPAAPLPQRAPVDPMAALAAAVASPVQTADEEDDLGF